LASVEHECPELGALVLDPELAFLVVNLAMVSADTDVAYFQLTVLPSAKQPDISISAQEGLVPGVKDVNDP